MQYHVNCRFAGSGDGTKDKPFRTISEAAQLAVPGDEVLVYPGIYREHVDPACAGTPDARITYHSVRKGGAVISAAESVKTWKKLRGSVWTARIDNRIFGARNPYKTLIRGDWYIPSKAMHTGEVFLNDKSLYEVTSLKEVRNPVPSKVSWDPAFSVYTWYCEQDDATDETILYANFHEFDPNKENVEISVRPYCFYPTAEGRGYITLSGFKIEKAATQWAPPTAYQEGMVGPHWSKGWIIEDCEIANSKCSGISLGKYLQPENDNKWLIKKFKDGTQTERDCICQAQREGWVKERIGSHIIRRCEIHDCGQTGIVGHLGGVFSLIEDNHIHHINNKQNLAGAEIGGIKMHAAIDCVYRRNHIHHCTRGLWLDWQAQGTRVTQNFFHDNTLPFDHLMCPEAMGARGEDIFIEVSHGPTLIDNNILLSDRTLKLCTQGVAVVHNLIGGAFAAVGTGVDNGSKTKKSPRYTPYHVPHRTEVAGFMTILHGDMRFYNNIFIQQPIRPFLKKLEAEMEPNDWEDGNATVGTKPYDGYMTSEEWTRMFDGYCGMGSNAPSDRYYMPLPVWTGGNVFVNGAKPCSSEQEYTRIRGKVKFSVEEKNGKYRLKTNLYEILGADCAVNRIDTETLGMAFEPEEKYENPDGSPIIWDTDYFGKKRRTILPGPFADGGAAGQPIA
ncbi:MAG: right-handed parallel beta-helix repeat-containing protein [Lachnospiraceae bacterium]|nr:right-handed parallel beta-helix repeat-containing protein [Lachnospiraceae bacterium]